MTMLTSFLFFTPLLSLDYGTAWTIPQSPIHLPTTRRFSSSRPIRDNERQAIQKITTHNNAALAVVKGGGEGVPAAEQIVKRTVPSFLYALNASTKWLVTIAHTIAVWSRTHSFEGPYIVVGSIGAAFLTEVLKKWINQNRPDGAPFSDPGMPSSHSLVCFFAATAWINTLGLHATGHTIGCGLLLGSAMTVAALRVVCGYHSFAQIAVGAGIGTTLGMGWSRLGSMLHLSNPDIMFKMAWAAYLGGSALFISKRMKSWVSHEKAL